MDSLKCSPVNNRRRLGAVSSLRYFRSMMKPPPVDLDLIAAQDAAIVAALHRFRSGVFRDASSFPGLVGLEVYHRGTLIGDCHIRADLADAADEALWAVYHKAVRLADDAAVRPVVRLVPA